MDRLDRIRGCLVGGGAGDALGYAIEFWQESMIFSKYGLGGIEAYEADPATGLAQISDDTQMTLFTAIGLLHGDDCRKHNADAQLPRTYVLQAYGDWLTTQTRAYSPEAKENGWNWLMDIPALYSRRAPGNTCLGALTYMDEYTVPDMDYVKMRINNSKGCGGVMRTAPVALLRGDGDLKEADMEAAQIAALTHGHPLGYMPSAVLNHILSRIVFGEEERPLKEIVIEARDTVCDLFAGEDHVGALRWIIDLAIELSENDDNDLDNIHRIGEGWVGEEALGIALYCSLRHEFEFSEGIIAAVNHKGDSDSTGAVTGNILGAINGYEAMEEKWKKNLECLDVLLKMADELDGTLDT